MPIGGRAKYNGPQRPPLTRNPSRPGNRSHSISAADSIWTNTEVTTDRFHQHASLSSPATMDAVTTESNEPATVVQTWRNPSANKWRILSACLASFGQGFNDSAPGALLPYVEQHYSIDYAAVASIFIANAIGFIVAAFFVHTLDRRFGRAKTLVFCEALNAVAFAIMIIPPPFAIFALGYFVTGYSLATTLSLNNVFCANTEPATIVLGAFHGSYGAGGTAAPLIATAMVTSGIEFSRFFSILLSVRVLSAVCLGSAFRRWDSSMPASQTLANSQHLPLQDFNNRLEAREAIQATDQRISKVSNKSVTLLPALKNKITVIGALFIFAYQGAEVSISGWVISFLITVRHGQPSRVGNVTAGFWGGITLGRFIFPPLAQRMGEKVLTYGLILGAIAFEIAVWRLKSIVGDSVFIALLGLLLGPIYPCATVVFTRLLPKHLQHTALAFTSSAGSSGGAVAPFLTGLVAQRAGTWVLHPIAISLCVVMMACWLALPRTAKRSE